MKGEAHITGINSINSTNLSFRTPLFAAFCAIGIAVFSGPLRELASLSLHDDLYSHIGLIPPFSFAIIYLKRREIFRDIEYAPAKGAAVILTGLVLLLISKIFQPDFSADTFLTFCISGYVIWTIGSFIGFYGLASFRKAKFSLLFLLFIVPIPPFVLDRLVSFLQNMTAEVVDLIFSVIGLPYFRHGTIFQLPEMTIQVAEQCSGIRSGLALIVATTAAGYVFLESGWRRLILVLAIIPIAIFKNALRIATLTLLAAYVDPVWLTDSWLHRAGGKPFFILALLLWSPILWLLWRSEHKGAKKEGGDKWLKVQG